MAVELQNEKAFQKQFGVFVGKQRLLGKGDGKELRYFKDIGLGYKTPKAAIEGTYVDHKCPFTSSVSIRGRIITGIVKSTKMQRTIIVRRDYLHFVPKYSRYEKRHRNIPAHCSPCFNVKEGDRVVIGQCRPLSKTVRFNVIKVVDTKKNKISTRRARRIAQIRKGIARGTYRRKRVVKATKSPKVAVKKTQKKPIKKASRLLTEERIKKLAEKKLNKKAKKESQKKKTAKGKKQPAKGKKPVQAKKVEKKPAQPVEKKEVPKKTEVKQAPVKKEQPKKEAPAKKEQQPKQQAPVKKEQPKKQAAPAKKEQPKKQAAPAKKEQPKKQAAPAKKEQPKKAAAKPQAKTTKKK